MAQRQKDRDGTTRILSGNVATRWGTIATWPYFGGEIDEPVVFADGKPARLGDIVISTNLWAHGQVCTVIKVYPTGNVDVRAENFRLRLATDTTWHNVGASGEPAFTAAWSNYGWPYQDARFRKVDGQVFIEGLIKSTTGAIGPIFVLPPEFRPIYNHLFTAAVSAIYTTTNGDTTTTSELTGGTHSHSIPLNVTLGPNNETVVHSHNVPSDTSGSTNTSQSHSHSLDQHNHELQGITARVDIQANGTVYLATPIHADIATAFVSLSAISYYVME